MWFNFIFVVKEWKLLHQKDKKKKKLNQEKDACISDGYKH